MKSERANDHFNFLNYCVYIISLGGFYLVMIREL